MGQIKHVSHGDRVVVVCDTPKHFSFLIFKGGACWLYVNLYKVESSLKTLALKFGNLSTNKANITIFVIMLENFRFNLDGEELVISS